MFGLTVGELALWGVALFFLIALVFNPKPLKQIASESAANTVRYLRWSGPVLLWGLAAMAVFMLWVTAHHYKLI